MSKAVVEAFTRVLAGSANPAEEPVLEKWQRLYKVNMARPFVVGDNSEAAISAAFDADAQRDVTDEELAAALEAVGLGADAVPLFEHQVSRRRIWKAAHDIRAGLMFLAMEPLRKRDKAKAS